MIRNRRMAEFEMVSGGKRDFGHKAMPVLLGAAMPIKKIAGHWGGLFKLPQVNFV
jgi:hypothetical protein